MTQKTIRSRFKKNFGRAIASAEINKVFDDWLEHAVIKPLLRGGEVKIDSYSTIEIVGSPIWKDKFAVGRLIKGLLKQHHRRPDIKYAIVYKNSLCKRPLYFRATEKLKKRAHETICNTNVYFKIE